MKIAIISSDIIPADWGKRYGGLEVVCYNLAKELAEMGHDVVLFALESSEAPKDVKLIGFRREEEIADHISLLKDADIVSYHGWKKVIWQLRDRIPNFTVHHHGPHIGYELPQGHLNLVGLSKFHARLLQAECNREVRFCYNGVDLNLYPLNTSKRSGRVLFLNRLHPEKCVHIAISLAEQYDLELDVIGTDSLLFCPEDYLRVVFRRFDGEKVRFWADPGYHMKLELLQSAKCLIWPCLWPEPFGLGIVESMAVGTPVISFAWGAPTEIIQEGGVLITH
ncbi:MAG: glycosyltransferase, partial [Thermoplasmata archaeon]|nr:glycosyltransferase [Thermoplasmata archaeon]